MKIKIEKKVPIPERYIHRSEHYNTIAKMKVGDSVFFDNPKEANKFIGCCIATFRKLKFTRRTSDKGIRIWRIK